MFSVSAQADFSTLHERRGKQEFLENLIAGISTELDQPLLDISVNKILAGLEAEKTNELLVALHDAAQHHIAKGRIRSADRPGSHRSRFEKVSFHQTIADINRSVAYLLHTIIPDLESELEEERSVEANEREELVMLLNKLGTFN